MPNIAFAIPVLPGKADELRAEANSQMHGERQAGYRASRERAGITKEAGWLQQTPMGDLCVVYIEADDIAAMFEQLGTSQDPFDVWFRESAREIHGINIEDGFPPPEQLLDYSTVRALS